MSNPNANPLTNPVGPNDLIRMIQEGYAGLVTPAQLAAGALPCPYIVAQSAVPASVTGTAAETTLATIAIPAGALGVNGSLRVTTLWSTTNSANNKVLKVKLGSAAYMSLTATTTVCVQQFTAIRNRGVLNSQVGFSSFVAGGFSVTANSAMTSAIDMSQAQLLTITGQLVTTTETITLEGYTVEILNP